MITEIASMVIVLDVVGVLAVVGNRRGWWIGWLQCALGGLAAALLIALASPMSGFATGVIAGIMGAALKWMGSEHSPVAHAARLHQANEAAQ